MLDAHTAIAADDVMHSNAPSRAPAPAAEAAPAKPVPLPLRNDTLLGVCEAIGQDFGFNANYLRILFAVGLYVSPYAVIGGYLGLGAVVAVSRWLYPRPAAAAATPVETVRETEQPLPLAA